MTCSDSTYRPIVTLLKRVIQRQFGAFYYGFLLAFSLLAGTANTAFANTPDTLVLTSVHTAQTLDCGDELIVFDRGGADGDGFYPSGYATTNWLYLRTSGMGTPIHIQIDATLASDCSLTLFNEYPSDDEATSPSFPANYPGAHGIYRATTGTTSGTVVSATGKVSIRFSKSVVSSSRTCNFRIRIWMSDTSEIYNIQNSAVTANSAHIAWLDSSAATSWTVQYGTSETNLNQSVTVSTTEATLTGLQSNRPYYIRIYNNAGTTPASSGYCTNNGTMIVTRGGDALPQGCIGDFTDLSSEGVICSYGFYDNPDENYGVQTDRHSVMTSVSAYDPIVSDSLLLVPNGSTASVRLGNSSAGNQAESIIYRFQVDASQSDMLLLRYAVVMQNPSHAKGKQPRMLFQIMREDGSEINDVCYEAEFVSSHLLNGESPWHDHGPLTSGGVHVLWHDWTSVGVNLTPFDGEVLYIKLTTKDCNESASNHGGAHFCYAYFTMECAKKDITYSGCSPDGNAEFLAPEGFVYDWHELGSATTLSTQQRFTPPTGATATYECTMKFSGANDAECSFSMTASPTMAALYPQALFTGPDTIEATDLATFTNTSFASSDEEGNTPVSGATCRYYLWDFGDGTTSSTTDATHQYPSGLTNRTYTVTLTAYISDSCTSQYQKTVVVKADSDVHYPDNMDSVDCAFTPVPTDWSIKLDAMLGTGSSGDSICTLINPLVGDLDGDGTPEIVCFSTRNAMNNAFTGSGNPGSKVKNVVVYDGRTLRRKAKFDLPAYVSAFEATPFGLAKLYNGDGLMVFACVDNNLYAYKLNGTGGATQVWGGVSYGGSHDYATVVGFADFNNDSIPEVYVRNKIFNLATGDLLLTVSSTNQGATYAHVGSSAAASSGRYPLAASFACDIVGDAKCELLLGNQINSINITNTTGTTGNTSMLYARAPSTGVAGIGPDGHAQVADFNLDGHLDVLFTNRPNATNSGTVYVYVWDVYNNTVSTPIVQPVSLPGKSIPLIADIDNDGTPEVVLHCGISGANIRAYKYDAATATFSLFWTKGFSEDSYSNSMTLFDFNQDGENELLICDQSNISIVNGSTPALAQTAISTLSFREVTIMQYPLIVDVDNDGAAEIVFVGKQNSVSYQGTLNICRSNGEPWAPARPVWNQYMYNITNVNKDLTIPAVVFNNAAAFTDPDSGVVRRPFNNFLQQATSLDLYGRPFYTAADLQPGSYNITLTAAGAHLVFDVCNVGTTTFTTDTLHTQIYIDQFGGTHMANIATYGDAGQPLQILPDSCHQVEITIPYSRICPYMPFDTMVFAINDIGQGVAEGGLPPECNVTNNIFSIANEVLIQRDTINDSTCRGAIYDRNGFYVTADTTSIVGMHQIVDTVSDASSCERIRTLMLKVLDVYAFDTTIQVCDSLIWYGTVLQSSGTYTETLTTASGCDSVITLHLTVASSYDVDTIAMACDRFTWQGNTYTRSDTVTYSTTTTSGCDSVVTLYLSIASSYDFDTTDQACGLFQWDATHQYDQSGNYVVNYTSSQGCDSVWSLHLTINYDTAIDRYYEACNAINYQGHRYTSDTLLVETLTTAQGCDSIVHVHLRVYPTWNIDTTIVACDSIHWNGYTLTNSRIGTYHFTAQGGCDSTVVLHLTINRSVYADSTAHSCGPFQWDEDSVYSTSGNYVIPYTSSVGCDSIWTLHLFVHEDAVTNLSYEGCDKVIVLGQTYTRDTMFVDSLLTRFGCDSLIQRQIIVHQSTYDTVVDSILEGQVYLFNDVLYSDSGLYTFNYINVDGCDSVVTLNLSIYELCSEFLQFPNLVTPNGDGINDRFVIKNLVDEGCYPINHLSIYNRWGALVFDAENITKDSEFWDPAKDNSPTGTYFFIFRGKGYKGRMERRGAIELIK